MDAVAVQENVSCVREAILDITKDAAVVSRLLAQVAGGSWTVVVEVQQDDTGAK